MKSLFTILFITLSAALYAQEDDRGYIVEAGQTAPDFTVTTTDGKTFRLSDQRGKVVMLQFTASWCGVCRKEMPHIEKEIWLPLKDKDFVLIGLDRDEPVDVVKDFAGKMKITYPLAPDPGANVFVLYALKEAGVTRNVIIGRDGKIVFLTRLYEEKEFNAMKEVIYELVYSPYQKIDRLSWLSGPWVNVTEEGLYYESWGKLNDSVYAGHSYMIKNNDTVFSEKLSLESSGDELYYIPVVSNQNDGKPVSFRLVSDIGGEFIFENQEHDFPQRIIYVHPSPDSLNAWIEGMVNGVFRKEEFPMTRKR